MLFREQCIPHISSCAVSSQPLNSCFYVILLQMIVCLQATRGRFPHALFREQCIPCTTSCALCLNLEAVTSVLFLLHLYVCAGHQGSLAPRAVQGAVHSPNFLLCPLFQPLSCCICVILSQLIVCAGHQRSLAPRAVQGAASLAHHQLCRFVSTSEQ
jgi:hypothetical protein